MRRTSTLMCGRSSGKSLIEPRATLKRPGYLDPEVDFVLKTIRLLLGILALYWVITTALEDLLAFIGLVLALWLVFGEHHNVAATGRKLRPKVRLQQDTGRSLHIEAWLSKLHTPNSTSMADQTSALYERLSYLVKTINPKANDLKNNDTSSGTLHDLENADDMFLLLCQLVEVYDGTIDRHDILVCMNELATLCEAGPTVQDIAGNQRGAHQVTVQSNPNGVAEILLDPLMKQHEYPTLNEGPLDKPMYAKWDLVEQEIILKTAATSAIAMSDLPRSIMAHTKDITVLLSNLVGRMPNEIAEDISKLSHPLFWRLWSPNTGLITMLEQSTLNMRDNLAYLAHSSSPSARKPVLSWLDRIEHANLYDPNAFGPCVCGEAAAYTLIQYHNEAEPHNAPSSSNHSTFPLSCTNDEYMQERVA
ncbi:hypothetical protein EK21DRAFT_105768 [Setomelanomma holmii]|uniref:Uncharacterized protein n=1 Tax=Setomelanomma holmii TaxID=210430 RepID=A0A9P4LQQ4_9PLEO|nr:hypothetical protein EK21DRAFT_105768 [Setomelanomma holmii]